MGRETDRERTRRGRRGISNDDEGTSVLIGATSADTVDLVDEPGGVGTCGIGEGVRKIGVGTCGIGEGVRTSGVGKSTNEAGIGTGGNGRGVRTIGVDKVRNGTGVGTCGVGGDSARPGRDERERERRL